MNPPLSTAVAAILCAVYLAGCGDSGPKEIEVAPGQVVVIEEPIKPGNGIVAGIVGDDAIYPLGGAVVRIVGIGNYSSTSDTNGRFAIVDVPPGIYILEGTKKNHAPVQTTVDVQPDKIAKAVLLLTRIPPTDPYHITFGHNGFVTFSGLRTTSGTVNTTFQFALDPSTPRTIVLESKWDTNFITTGQRPVLAFELYDVGLRTIEADEVPNPFVRALDARILTPGHMAFNIRIQPNQPEPIVYQGKSQDFVTVFYNRAAPDGWSKISRIGVTQAVFPGPWVEAR